MGKRTANKKKTNPSTRTHQKFSKRARSDLKYYDTFKHALKSQGVHHIGRGFFLPIIASLLPGLIPSIVDLFTGGKKEEKK